MARALAARADYAIEWSQESFGFEITAWALWAVGILGVLFLTAGARRHSAALCFAAAAASAFFSVAGMMSIGVFAMIVPLSALAAGIRFTWPGRPELRPAVYVLALAVWAVMVTATWLRLPLMLPAWLNSLGFASLLFYGGGAGWIGTLVKRSAS